MKKLLAIRNRVNNLSGIRKFFGALSLILGGIICLVGAAFYLIGVGVLTIGSAPFSWGVDELDL